MKIEWVKPKRGRSGGAVTSGLRITRNDYRCKKTSVLRISTVLRISVDVMRKARFVIGDRIAVGVAEADGKKFVVIRRVPDSGFTISTNDKSKKGSCTLGHVKISATNIPLGGWSVDDIRIAEDGTLFFEVNKNAA